MNTVKATFTLMDSTLTRTQGQPISVQFNPESLKVSYTNQIKQPNGTGDQRGPAALQFVGSGTTKMSGQLWFDAPAMGSNGDVRNLTGQIIGFMTPTFAKTSNKTNYYTPPFVQFQWGTFIFKGIMDSAEENLEFFSPTGLPLRASVNFSLLNQTIQFLQGQQSNPQTPGNAPMTSAPQGSTLQGLATAAGRPGSWQQIASANGIDNPRMLATGQLLDMNADLTGGLSVGAATGVLGSVSVGFTGIATASIGGSVSVGANVNASGSLGASVGGTASFGISGSVSASASAAFTVG
jgi:hypothetical protein